MLIGGEAPVSPHPSSGVSQSQERWHKAWPQSAPDSVGPEGTRRHGPVCGGHPRRAHLAWTRTHEWKTCPESSAGNSTVVLSWIKGRSIFNLKARVAQRKTPVSCSVPCRVPSWLIGVHPTCVCMCVCLSLLAPVCRPSASPGLDSCRLRSEGPLNLGGYSFPHICYEFTRAKPFKGSFMEPSAALWLLPIKTHAHLVHMHTLEHTHIKCRRPHAYIYTANTYFWIGVFIYNVLSFSALIPCIQTPTHTHIHIYRHVNTRFQFLTKPKNLNLSQTQQLQPSCFFFKWITRAWWSSAGVVIGPLHTLNYLLLTSPFTGHMHTPEKHEPWQQQGHHVTLDGSDLERKKKKI